PAHRLRRKGRRLMTSALPSTAASVLARADLTLRQIANGVKGIDRDARSVDAVMSTPALDRYGERVDPAAFGKRMEAFLAAPRLLFNHDHDRPIGRWENVRATSGGLTGTAIFDTSPEGELRFNQILEGSLNSFSVAWLTHAWEMRDEQDDDGTTRRVRVFTDVELLECSLVTIPANPEALIRAASFGGRSTSVDHPAADQATVLAALERIERRLDALEPDLDGSAAGEGLMDLRGTRRGGGHAPDWLADAYFDDDATHPPPEEGDAARAVDPAQREPSEAEQESLRAWLSDELGLPDN
ncbi:MAG: HK97 family phage prohead protease, partial [Planctomycetota bacterium]